jgi:hypothetical protein
MGINAVIRVAGSWLLAGALFLLSGSAQCAYGDTFSLDWLGAYGPGSAVLTATFVGAGTYIVTAMTGVQNGSAVSLITGSGYGNDDNAIYPEDAIQLDFDGLSFSAGGLNYKLFAYTLPGNTNTYTECSSIDAPFCVGIDVNNGLAVDSLNIAPEPASIALLGTMALGVIGLRRRRSSRA